MDGMREHEQHEHLDGRHDHNDSGGDAKLHGGPMDLAAVRAKLQSKTGKQYWRTLEELAGDPEFEELLHREFPRQAPSSHSEGACRGNSRCSNSSNSGSPASSSSVRQYCLPVFD